MRLTAIINTWKTYWPLFLLCSYIIILKICLTYLLFSVSPVEVWGCSPVWSRVWNHIKPCPVHLWCHGDSSHRDQMGLSHQEGWLLHQPLPQSQTDQQGNGDSWHFLDQMGLSHQEGWLLHQPLPQSQTDQQGNGDCWHFLDQMGLSHQEGWLLHQPLSKS